jgi:hypothetical protein
VEGDYSTVDTVLLRRSPRMPTGKGSSLGAVSNIKLGEEVA